MALTGNACEPLAILGCRHADMADERTAMHGDLFRRFVFLFEQPPGGTDASLLDPARRRDADFGAQQAGAVWLSQSMTTPSVGSSAALGRPATSSVSIASVNSPPMILSGISRTPEEPRRGPGSLARARLLSRRMRAFRGCPGRYATIRPAIHCTIRPAIQNGSNPLRNSLNGSCGRTIVLTDQALSKIEGESVRNWRAENDETENYVYAIAL